MELYNHQKEFLNDKREYIGLFWTVGMGKTIAAIKFMERDSLTNVLVICPKGIKEQWEQNISIYTSEKRLWKVMSKEEFKKNPPTASIGGYKRIIVDESHYFHRHTSQLHKALYKYTKENEIKRLVLATGTPYMSTAWNIYAIARLLGYEPNYIKWKFTFFKTVNMGGREIPIEKTDIKTKEKIIQLLHKLGSVKKMEDCFDVPEQIFDKINIKLTKEQEKIIEKIKNEEPQHIVRWTKIHQVCGGYLKDEDGDKKIKNNKLETLLELVRNNKKIFIVCKYRGEIDIIEEEIKNKIKKHQPIYRITGDTAKDRYETIKKADESEISIILATAQCSEGYECPSIPVMVFYSYDFSLKNYEQIKGRIQRSNKLKKNLYISLVVPDSIDSDVYRNIMSKRDFQIKLYNK